MISSKTSSRLDLRTTTGLHVQNKTTIVNLKLGTLLYRLNKSIKTTVLFQITAWSSASSGCTYQPKRQLITSASYYLTPTDLSPGLRTGFLSSIRLTTTVPYRNTILTPELFLRTRLRPVILQSYKQNLFPYLNYQPIFSWNQLLSLCVCLVTSSSLSNPVPRTYSCHLEGSLCHRRQLPAFTNCRWTDCDHNDVTRVIFRRLIPPHVEPFLLILLFHIYSFLRLLPGFNLFNLKRPESEPTI